jgi:signal transduction histidine kinase
MTARLLSRLRPSQVRVRLTLLYGGLFTLAGIALLAITYVLFANSPRTTFVTHTTAPGGQRPTIPADQLGPVSPAAQVQADGQRAAALHQLLVQSGIALAIMAVLSIGLGWLVAGRILRPLRTMTAGLRRISARNVHERLAATGPRDELRELSDTVDGLLARLDTALDAHKRFVANAAHELRTPLTVEHALLEEALLDAASAPAGFRDTVGRVLAVRERQARLLDSLLTLAEGERGLDRTEPTDLAACTRTVLADRAPMVRERGLRLHTEIVPVLPVLGDAALVARVVANLVDNAIGHNRPGGFLRVRTATGNGAVAVSVVNSGPVVPAEQVDRLFEPFQRLHRTADGHHGLGLSIVRAITVAHNGSVTATARPDGGLVVTVRFPVADALTRSG